MTYNLMLGLLMFSFSGIPVVEAQQATIVIPLVEGRFINQLEGTFVESGEVRAQTASAPRVTVATTAVGPDGRFVFHELTIPRDNRRLVFRGSSPDHDEEATSGVYTVIELAGGAGALYAASVAISYNPSGYFDLTREQLLWSGSLVGSVRDERSGEVVRNAVVLMTVHYKCGGPSSPPSAMPVVVPTDSSGRYRLWRIDLLNRIVGGSPVRWRVCHIREISSLWAEAPGYRPSMYEPREASSFYFYNTVYRRHFRLDPR